MNEYWHGKWETNDTKWDQQAPNPLLVKYFQSLNLKPGAKIFVPLSGKSIDMIWLANQGYQVIGVELSLKACELFFKENNLTFNQHENGHFKILSAKNITILSGDFFELDKNLLGNIDAIYDRAALVALAYDTQLKYVQKLNQLIEQNTQLLLITFSYNQQEMQGPPFSVSEKAVSHLFDSHFNCTVLSKVNMPNIPVHLRAKGLTQVHEIAFHLTKNNQ